MTGGAAETDSAVSERLYVEALTSSTAAHDWHEAVLTSKHRLFATLRATRYLTDIPAAIEADGSHVAILRHLLAPPISQDQFALLCPAYSKTIENSRRRFGSDAARDIAQTLLAARDKRITRWLDSNRPPTIREIRSLAQTVAPMLSQQIVATLRRNRLSAVQEGAVRQLLESLGWQRLSSGLVEESSALPAMHYMHKTRFATKTRPQEVDIACGLGKSVVLAMECKVTNDRTNSVKRVNDILKKASAWQDHWASFVETAALLQGVVAEKDVARLVAANVHVFWSHDLDAFAAWLQRHMR